jgi:hypothetical protein
VGRFCGRIGEESGGPVAAGEDQPAAGEQHDDHDDADDQAGVGAAGRRGVARPAARQRERDGLVLAGRGRVLHGHRAGLDRVAVDAADQLLLDADLGDLVEHLLPVRVVGYDGTRGPRLRRRLAGGGVRAGAVVEEHADPLLAGRRVRVAADLADRVGGQVGARRDAVGGRGGAVPVGLDGVVLGGVATGAGLREDVVVALDVEVVPVPVAGGVGRTGADPDREGGKEQGEEPADDTTGEGDGHLWPFWRRCTDETGPQRPPEQEPRSGSVP